MWGLGSRAATNETAAAAAAEKNSGRSAGAPVPDRSSSTAQDPTGSGDNMAGMMMDHVNDNGASTASSSSSSSSSIGGDDDDIPWFFYTRYQHDAFRRTAAGAPLDVPVTCSALGKLVLCTENVEVTDHDRNSVSPGVYTRHALPLAALGTQDGHVHVVDVESGTAIAFPAGHMLLPVREGSGTQYPIVGVSWDATGTYLAAMDQGGMCAILEIKYAIQLRSSSDHPGGPASTRPPPPRPAGAAASAANAIENFFWSAIGGSQGAPIDTGTSSDDEDDTAAAPAARPEEEQQQQQRLVPTLVMTNVQTHRLSYPKSFSAPTCLALDPSYKRRREKCLIAGFADGKLVATKRGFVFQRRHDEVLYQSVAPMSGGGGGGGGHDDGRVWAVAWRGALVAWADASGVRLLESDQWTRIAHVDRPAGARPSLYPSLQHIRPYLCWETATQLLVAWGDCLLQLSIRESKSQQQQRQQEARGGGDSNNEALSAQGMTEMLTTAGSELAATVSDPAVVRKRIVDCTMAWELDCVAAGVAPLDAQHVLVLGLVTPLHQQQDENDPTDEVSNSRPVATAVASGINEVELQVVSRMNGTVAYADLLPLARPAPKPQGLRRGRPPESAAAFQLLSSFAVPRMEDPFELYEEGHEDVPLYDGDNIFSREARRVFKDWHVRWSLNQAKFDQEGAALTYHDSDTDSVDSDDYDFIYSPVSVDGTNGGGGAGTRALPPSLLVASGHDLVLSRLRNVDDAVHAALVAGKTATALHRAIQHVRQLRRYRVDDLVNAYFCSLLRIRDAEKQDDGIAKMPSVDLSVEHEDELETKLRADDTRASPSLRRMKMAASAMPALLGGNRDMWQRWVGILEEIPGALFVVRSYLPVRDPVLPAALYARVLEKMLDQIEDIAAMPVSVASARLRLEAESHFLCLLVGWGHLDVLNEHIELYRFQAEQSLPSASGLRALEDALRRRRHQSAALYLRFPIEHATEQPIDLPSVSAPVAAVATGPLYNVQSLLSKIDMRRFRSDTGENQEKGGVRSPENADVPGAQNLASGPKGIHNLVLESTSKLSMMQGEDVIALQTMLRIAESLSTEDIQKMENDAVAAVASEMFEERSSRYAYVVAFIEKHHLHGHLLSASVLAQSTHTPVCLLLRLVGLSTAGDFLAKHCVVPRERAKKRSESGKGSVRRGTLPLDAVAEQLNATPKLLFWYLHLILMNRPEIYVKFGSMSSPPTAIASLYRKALEMYIKYAGSKRHSDKVLAGVEPYRAAEVVTPLLYFIKTILPLKGITASEIENMLKAERADVNSPAFALELAYLKEYNSDLSKDDAKSILDLYLKGAKSLVLAVSFAQRASDFSTELWETLIDYCLNSTQTSRGVDEIDGTLFGTLLEAAALSGGNLAHLVTQIPPGMAIEGLRPTLAAAVSDYGLKLQMHETVTQLGGREKSVLLMEEAHRARRGVWVPSHGEDIHLAVVATQTRSIPLDDDDEKASRAKLRQALTDLKGFRCEKSRRKPSQSLPMR